MTDSLDTWREFTGCGHCCSCCDYLSTQMRTMRSVWYEKGREDERNCDYDKAQHVQTDLANRQLLCALQDVERELDKSIEENRLLRERMSNAIDVLNFDD